jgi:SAM-dependent methyltransferase
MQSLSSKPSHREYLTSFFDGEDDPWRFRSSWYEARKRAIVLASLPTQRYLSGFEPGCANGELSFVLADRCDTLLVADCVTKAVDLARARTAALTHVHVTQMAVPNEWPSKMFDLIVISELGYYLTVQELEDLAHKVRASLRRDGTVLACHWRRPIAGLAMNGDGVNDILNDQLKMPRLFQLIDPDIRLDVWCTDPQSVAERENIA